jgi:hypothetical protein
MRAGFRFKVFGPKEQVLAGTGTVPKDDVPSPKPRQLSGSLKSTLCWSPSHGLLLEQDQMG